MAKQQIGKIIEKVTAPLLSDAASAIATKNDFTFRINDPLIVTPEILDQCQFAATFEIQYCGIAVIKDDQKQIRAAVHYESNEEKNAADFEKVFSALDMQGIARHSLDVKLLINNVGNEQYGQLKSMREASREDMFDICNEAKVGRIDDQCDGYGKTVILDLQNGKIHQGNYTLPRIIRNMTDKPAIAESAKEIIDSDHTHHHVIRLDQQCSEMKEKSTDILLAAAIARIEELQKKTHEQHQQRK